LERVSDNAYKVHLLGDYGVSAMFNVADLNPYLEDDYLANLRKILLNKGRMMKIHRGSIFWTLKTRKEFQVC